MRRGLQTLLAVAMLLMAVGVVSAVEPGGATVSGETNYGEAAVEAAGSADVEAGNITGANLEANQSTYRWAGLTGNTSGTIRLADIGGNMMYSWTALGVLVYAVESPATIAWATLADSTVADMPAYLTGTDSDNYTETFNESAENIGSGIYDTLTSDYTQSFNNAQVPTWKTYSLTDGVDLVWAGLVSEDGTNYRNQQADYQMMLPEDGEGGDTTVQAYNLYLELY